jgi:hypothetical protein
LIDPGVKYKVWIAFKHFYKLILHFAHDGIFGS